MAIELYDKIGRGYGQVRRPDPRIGAQILRALDGCSSVVNVGAGAGSYEPRDRRVVAVEPSMTMIRQRDSVAPPVVQGAADDLPFRDGAFEASLAILTIHHWPRHGRGLLELRRVARRRVVILTFDPYGPDFWLTDYFPEIPEIDRRVIPALEDLEDRLGPLEITDVPIPHDCSDGFLGAYWRRPEAYLSAGVRAGISAFSRLRDLGPGLARLQRDLDSGKWQHRYGQVLSQSSCDLGYRLVISETRSG